MQDVMLHETDAMLSNSLVGRLCMADATGRPARRPAPVLLAGRRD